MAFRGGNVLTANDAVASSRPWCFKSRTDPVTRLPDADRIDGRADVTEARDRRQERRLTLQRNCHNAILSCPMMKDLTLSLEMSAEPSIKVLSIAKRTHPNHCPVPLRYGRSHEGLPLIDEHLFIRK